MTVAQMHIAISDILQFFPLCKNEKFSEALWVIEHLHFTMIHKNRRGNRFSYQRIVVETKILLSSKRAHRIRSHIAFNLSIEKSIHFLPCWLISYACSFYQKRTTGWYFYLEMFILQSMQSTAPFIQIFYFCMIFNNLQS